MTHEEFEGRLAQSVSHETFQLLTCYVATLLKWSDRINLIARSTVPDVWHRHIIDSAQLYPIARAQGLAGKWLDLGSGGGLPALVLAILDRPNGWISSSTLIESDKRKATFLRLVSRELGLTLQVRDERIEEVQAQEADVITARAFAPLPKLLDLASRHLALNGKILLLKGSQAETEVQEARKHWHFVGQTFESRTQTDARILLIDGLKRNA
jgi:16S rRNA (guanine527-N7)-methyltransferase